jgi:hypothetical protein
MKRRKRERKRKNSKVWLLLARFIYFKAPIAHGVS